MKIFIKYLLFILIIPCVVRSQDSLQIKEMRKIFINLEYNTIAYDDLKKKWFINDPEFVRDVYSRFIINNELRIDGRPASSDVIREKSNGIFDGNIIIDVRKRFYDDELEYFAFVPSAELEKEKPAYLFDPVEDPFELKTIIGQNLYERIQKQQYFFSDITKKVYDTKPGYYFDLNLNVLEPEVMFWSTTSNQRNKYLVSVIGKWGNNRIFLPGWYCPEYTVGFQLAYHKILSSDPNDYTYKVALGTGRESGKPYVKELPKAPLYKSADNIYFKVSGNLSEYIFPSFPKVYMNLEGQISYNDYKNSQFGFTKTTQFYSIRDYASLSFIKRDLANVFNLGMLQAGFGISTFSTFHYEIDPTKRVLTQLDHKDYFDKFTHIFSVDVGLSKRGGLLQHETNVTISYGSEGYGFIGFDVKFMVNDTFGFMAGFYSGFGLDLKAYPYKTDRYLVFSPVIRINY
ncbi:MAG: hypothetical protein V1773_04275 [bacterium]